MKVEATKVFFDNNGLHKVGDIVEVENLNENLMKPIKEAEKAPAKVAKKVTTKKK